MAKLIVLGLTGEEGIWLADLEAGTVTAVDPEVIAEAEATDNNVVGTLRSAEASGHPVVQGISFAIATTSRSVASSQEFFHF